MNTYDFVHLVLRAMGGQIQGRTYLQKIVYFLGIMNRYPDDLGYRAHYYGPYSSEVSDAVDRLLSLGFLDQRVAGVGAFDPRGFEVARYDYSLTAEGRSLAEQKTERYRAEWQKLQEAAAILREAGDLDYMELSVAAKSYFVLRQKGNKATFEEISAVASSFGWSVKPEEIAEAADFLSKAGLITVSQK